MTDEMIVLDMIVNDTEHTLDQYFEDLDREWDELYSQEYEEEDWEEEYDQIMA